MKNQAFTLIEILVAVLIIGILAAVAVPKYQEVVEKSIMQEAIINVRKIANANDAFYLQNGRYANGFEMDKLDISIPGTLPYIDGNGHHKMAIRTTYFEYKPDGGGGTPNDPHPAGYKAMAQRVPEAKRYFLYIQQGDNKLKCWVYSNATRAQAKLCDKIKKDGHL